MNVEKGQESFIENVSQCLQEASEFSVWRPVGIYIDHVLVGFSMYCLWEEDEGDDRVWLDRLLIDEQYQGRGYGKACMPLLIARLKEEYQCNEIYLSVIQENVQAIRLYERFGFRFNGEIDLQGEKIMRLEIDKING